jgi:hypothetical protein
MQNHMLLLLLLCVCPAPLTSITILLTPDITAVSDVSIKA